MNFNVEVTSKFKRNFKQLLKKYPSLSQELILLINSLEIDPKQGKSLGHDCYKIRLSIGSKGKGKSGGARVITHVHVSNTTIFLIAIFDKSEQASISDKEILSYIKDI